MVIFSTAPGMPSKRKCRLDATTNSTRGVLLEFIVVDSWPSTSMEIPEPSPWQSFTLANQWCRMFWMVREILKFFGKKKRQFLNFMQTTSQICWLVPHSAPLCMYQNITESLIGFTSDVSWIKTLEWLLGTIKNELKCNELTQSKIHSRECNGQIYWKQQIWAAIQLYK